MIHANIDYLGRSGVHSLQKQIAALMSGENYDCYVHYYIQQQNTSIA